MASDVIQHRFDALHQSDDAVAEAEALQLSKHQPTVVISGCLAGVTCRYDGGSQPLEPLPQTLRGKTLVPLCPEVLAGLGVPRPKSWFVDGDGADVLAGRTQLVNESGDDVTTAFLAGCNRALRLAQLARCEHALLKERSPSCGVHEVWSEQEKRVGAGLFAALLARRDITLESE